MKINHAPLHQLLPILVFALLLDGCSAIKLSYDFADWLIEYRVEKLVDLSGEQEDDLQEKLQPFFRWHRQKIMPQIISMSSELKDAVPTKTVVQTFAKQRPLLDELYAESAGELARIVGDTFFSLTAEQVNELEANLKETFDEKFSEATKNPKKQHQRFVKRIEEWVGGFSDGQQEFFKESQSVFQNHNRLRFECRRVRETELVTALREKKAREMVQDVMVRWWTLSSCGAEIKNATSLMRSTMTGQLAELEKTLDEDQTKELANHLGDLHEDLSRIER